MTAARIAPLEAPYSPPVQAALDRIMPAGVPPLALFRALAVNERVEGPARCRQATSHPA
jgi:hypothetical protein